MGSDEGGIIPHDNEGLAMPQRDPTVLRSGPHWYGELNVGVGLLLFAVITAYPWRDTPSALALVVAACLAIPGVFVLVHAGRLGKRMGWHWIEPGSSPSNAIVPSKRVTAGTITLLLAAVTYGSFDLSAPTVALRPGWWLILAVGIAFSLLIFVAWRAGTKDRVSGVNLGHPPASNPTYTPGEKRSTIAAAIAFFILGLAVLLSFNFQTGSIVVEPYAWFLIPAGFASAAAILIANRRSMRKARLCRWCGQHVPLGVSSCPSCGRPFV
jgi:uncharacterized membrane protein HdeD (DUF308 family)